MSTIECTGLEWTYKYECCKQFFLRKNPRINFYENNFHLFLPQSLLVALDTFDIYPIVTGVVLGLLVALLASLSLLRRSQAPLKLQLFRCAILFVVAPTLGIIILELLFLYIKWWYNYVDPNIGGYWGTVTIGLSCMFLSFALNILSEYLRYPHRRGYMPIEGLRRFFRS
jgi:hypothetical protein